MGGKLNHELLRRNHSLHYVMTNAMTITLFQNSSYHTEIILKIMCIKNFAKVNNFCMRSYFMSMENCIRNSDILIKIACLILQNLALVDKVGNLVKRIWNRNVITTVESSWCMINIVTNICQLSFPSNSFQ